MFYRPASLLLIAMIIVYIYDQVFLASRDIFTRNSEQEKYINQ